MEKSICVEQPVLFVVFQSKHCGKWSQNHFAMLIIRQLLELIEVIRLQKHYVSLGENTIDSALF